MEANTTQTDRHPGMEENLSSYFQRSATIVRQYADLIEQEYAQPILRHASLKFREKPITMTFLAIFAGLSVFPLLSFIGFTIFAFSSLAFLAFISTAILFIIIESVLVACLVFTLWALFIAASFTTAIVVFIYCTMRLGVLVTYEGRSGIADWVYETRDHFYARRQEASEESEEFAVLGDQDGPSSKKIKAEE